jgi:predicted ABC-type exoprotein transport system permease subunit
MALGSAPVRPLYLLESDQVFLLNGASRLKQSVHQAIGLPKRSD